MIRGESPALWILSKISMLFFIISLAAILMVASSQWRSNLCYTQALSLSQTVSSSIGDALNSPLEDQRNIVSLPYSILVGNGIDSRYSMNLSELSEIASNGVSATDLLVSVFSQYDPSCKASVIIPFDSTQYTLFFIASLSRKYNTPASNILQTLQFLPSLQPDYSNGGVQPNPQGLASTFVSIVKCQSKTPDKTKHLFIEDCTHKNSNKCIGLSNGDSSISSSYTLQTACGYG